MIREKLGYLFEIASLKKSAAKVTGEKISVKEGMFYYLTPYIFYITIAFVLTTAIILQQEPVIEPTLTAIALFSIIWVIVFVFAAALGYGIGLGGEAVLCILFKLFARMYGKKLKFKTLYPPILTVGAAVTLVSLPLAFVQPFTEAASPVLKAIASTLLASLGTLLFLLNLYLEYKVLKAMTRLSAGKTLAVVLGAYVLLAAALLAFVGFVIIVIGIELLTL